jgi:Flp pilus assembly pilin Flp
MEAVMKQNWLRLVMARLAESDGAVGSEHALLLTLIAMAIFLAVQGFGQAVYNTCWAVASTLISGS